MGNIGIKNSSQICTEPTDAINSEELDVERVITNSSFTFQKKRKETLKREHIVYYFFCCGYFSYNNLNLFRKKKN